MPMQEPCIQGGAHLVPLGLPQILGLHTQALLSPAWDCGRGFPGSQRCMPPFFLPFSKALSTEAGEAVSAGADLN